MSQRLVRAVCAALITTYTISLIGVLVYLSRILRACPCFL
jgi:hypothetical protein